MKTIDKIFNTYESESEPPRGHLGGSQIGSPCARALWYGFRWADSKQFDGRMLRLFKRGHRTEHIFISELEKAGVTIYQYDPNTGEQFNYNAFGGHFAGSTDGVGKGVAENPEVWHLLEFKTHNERSFKTLEAQGVEKSKPEHFAQMQIYMHWSKLKAAFYLSENKNNDALYSEIIEYDEDVAARLLNKAERIIESPIPLERVSDDPDYYRCGPKWCEFRDICQGRKTAKVNCRTCVHSTPDTSQGGARWTCARFRDSVIPLQAQRAGCPEHRFIPDLVSWAKPVDASKDDNWVEYELDGGFRFKNGSGGENGYTSNELSAVDKSNVGFLLGDSTIASLRDHLDAELIEYKKNEV